jgi:hypothetical protein
MKTVVLLLLCCLPACGQNPDTIKYAPRQVLLVDPTPGTEAVLPMIVTTDGAQRLEFVPTHQIKEFLDKGARPVTLGDILALLGGATEKVNQLQAENEKLWKVAMKSGSVVVEAPPSAPQPDIAAIQREEKNARRQQLLQTWMMLQGMNRPQPYQVPMPVNPNANRVQTNCTTYRLGDMTHTSCN